MRNRNYRIISILLFSLCIPLSLCHCSSNRVFPSIPSAFIHKTTITTTTTTTTTATAFPPPSSSLATTRRNKVAFSNMNSSKSSVASDTASQHKAKIPNIDSVHVEQLVGTANSFASANGLEIEKKRSPGDDDSDGEGRGGGGDDGDGGSSSYFLTAPISLLPNAIPRTAFENAQQLAEPYNLLVDRVSRDSTFLYETLIDTGVAQADPYTNKLVQLHQQYYGKDVEVESYAKQADYFNVHRSDYMLNETQELRQIELNTIAASFASLSCKVSQLHSYLTERFNDETSKFLQSNVAKMNPNNKDKIGEVPVNPALDTIPAAMALATKRYQDRFSPTTTKIAILFVVQDGESNTVDQRMIEFQLWQQHQIPVIRMSLSKIHKHVENKDGILTTLGGKYEIALVYYRAGYAPTDYPGGYNDGIEWQARAKLEDSRATKSPSLGYHLVGTKKVQQQLARPGVLEKFFPNEPDLVAIMRSSFAGLWSLGMDDATAQDLDAVKRVLDDGLHDQFVLKPQREGGGYNFYGIDVANKLRPLVKKEKDDNDGGNTKITLDQELGEYILMERIFPKLQPAALLRAGKLEGVGDSLSELGIYGTILTTNDGQVLHNEYAGFLLRTKFANVNEGGVASGFATLSSPYLC